MCILRQTRLSITISTTRGVVTCRQRWTAGQVVGWTNGQVTTVRKGKPNMCPALIMSQH